MKKYYRFAGLQLELELPEKRIYQNEKALQPFAVDSVTDPHRFSFSLVDALKPPVTACIHNDGGFRVYEEEGWQVRYIGSVQNSWSAAYMRVAHKEKTHLVQLEAKHFPQTIGVHTVLTAMAVEHLIAHAGGFMFHSSYIEHEGKGILFTAPSGTGKSTQAELWRSLRGAEVINGDRSVIRMAENGIVVSGVPFAGSSQICKNRTLPLHAIVYLEQAPQTTIRRLKGFEAFRRIWEGVSVNTWDKEDVALASETAGHVAQRVPVYYLACTPDESAVIALEQALRE